MDVCVRDDRGAAGSGGRLTRLPSRHGGVTGGLNGWGVHTVVRRPGLRAGIGCCVSTSDSSQTLFRFTDDEVAVGAVDRLRLTLAERGVALGTVSPRE